jgi:hypothetical protein
VFAPVQFPLVHCSSLVQAAAWASFAWQAPPDTPSHQNPVTHFASPARSFVPQAVAHAVALAHTRCAGHAAPAPAGEQVPEPLQSGAGVSVLTVHAALPHVVEFDG